jgi:predicted Rdx family selenoprotein
MKACMAKQKASDGGMPKEQMKKNCRDVTKTERENTKAEKDAAAQSAESPSKVDHP